MDWIQEFIDKEGIFDFILFVIWYGGLLIGIIFGTWVNSVVKIMFILPLKILILILKSITKILEWIIEKIDTFFIKSRDIVKKMWDDTRGTKDNKDE